MRTSPRSLGPRQDRPPCAARTPSSRRSRRAARSCARSKRTRSPRRPPTRGRRRRRPRPSAALGGDRHRTARYVSVARAGPRSRGPPARRHRPGMCPGRRWPQRGPRSSSCLRRPTVGSCSLKTSAYVVCVDSRSHTNLLACCGSQHECWRNSPLRATARPPPRRRPRRSKRHHTEQVNFR